MLFDFEKLEVYRVIRQFMDFLQPVLQQKLPKNLHDQLDASSESIFSNLAEGAGKFSKPDKRRSYEYARGSAMESAAQIELLLIKGLITRQQYAQARSLLLSIVRMLSRLAAGPR